MITARDKFGHWIDWPGRIAYQHDNWRLIYVGSVNIDGTHEFLVEKTDGRINLGRVSFAEAKKQMLDLIEYDKLPR